jgi:hypothetical protein
LAPHVDGLVEILPYLTGVAERLAAQPLLLLSRRLLQLHGCHRGGSGSPASSSGDVEPPDLDHLQAMRQASVH